MTILTYAQPVEYDDRGEACPIDWCDKTCDDGDRANHTSPEVDVHDYTIQATVYVNDEDDTLDVEVGINGMWYSPDEARDYAASLENAAGAIRRAALRAEEGYAALTGAAQAGGVA